MGKSKDHSSRAQELEKQRNIQAAKRAARKAKKSRTIETPRVLDPKAVAITPLRMVVKTDRPTAYEKIKRATVLPLYAKKYKYDSHLRKATAHGGFEIEVPFIIAQQIERELQPEWQRGAMPELVQQEEETANAEA